MFFLSVLAVILAYVMGSLSFSTLISRWFAHIDIREHGSGNAGATNTLRVLGARYAVAVLGLDIGKGIAAVWLARWISHGSVWAVYAAGLAVIVGHNWPVFFGFRGGKGIAATIGVIATLMLVPGLLAGAIAIALLITTRLVSLGALVFTVLTPVFVLLMTPAPARLTLSLLIAALSIYRHKANIVRLVRGQEPRIFNKKF